MLHRWHIGLGEEIWVLRTAERDGEKGPRRQPPARLASMSRGRTERFRPFAWRRKALVGEVDQRLLGVPSSAAAAMPSDSVTWSGPSSVRNVLCCTASRMRSAMTWAPFPSVSGMMIANSSPP